tara:strand:- start:154 stop:711 length:558 start_codon:yes stop_codon:yes gene_type:complete
MTNEDYTFFNFLEDVSKKTIIKILPYTMSQVLLMLSLAEQEDILVAKEKKTGTSFMLTLYAIWQAAFNKKKVFYITSAYGQNDHMRLIYSIIENLPNIPPYNATYYRYDFNDGEIVFLHAFSRFQGATSDLIIFDEAEMLGIQDVYDLTKKNFIVVCEREKQRLFESLFKKHLKYDTYEMIEEIG